MAALCFSGTRNHKYHFTMNLYTTYHVMHLKVMIEASVSQNKLATKLCMSKNPFQCNLVSIAKPRCLPLVKICQGIWRTCNSQGIVHKFSHFLMSVKKNDFFLKQMKDELLWYTSGTEPMRQCHLCSELHCAVQWPLWPSVVVLLPGARV